MMQLFSPIDLLKLSIGQPLALCTSSLAKKSIKSAKVCLHSGKNTKKVAE